jgi:hypothetical protein
MSAGGILNAEAIQIVKVNEEAHTFRLSEEDLTRIILQENVRNPSCSTFSCVISMRG